ncbi:hypothetical protein BBP40_004072 [Aspergillus hancockii]|nr:hypothetical protein BBP40_004072 [Aspergillus hancockii]
MSTTGMVNMVGRLPLEILLLVFEHLTRVLLDQGRIREVGNLMLVSKGIQRWIEPRLYREIYTDGHYIDDGRGDRKAEDSQSPLLCRTMLNRPELRPHVKRISFEQSEVGCDDMDCASSAGSQESSESPFKPEEIGAAKLLMENCFRTDEAKSYWLPRLKNAEEAAMQGLLLCQLPNLVSLTLNVHSGMFGHIGTFLRLPYLEELSFIVDMGNWKSWYDNSLEEPEDVLESILSGAGNVKKLKFEHYANVYAPVEFNAARLKQILNQHVAETVESLAIVLSLHDQKDWRMPQECTRITGVLGSMVHFTKLKKLSIQLELLLGEPSANPEHLEDVLPNQLQRLTCLSLHSYDGDDEARIWDWDDCITEFQKLATAARCVSRFPELSQVDVDMYRKDDFTKYSGYQDSSGTFDEEGLVDSRIDFSWY